MLCAWLLSVPVFAVRDSQISNDLVLDAGVCEGEARNTKKLLEDLGYTGEPLEGNHCDWPGISCHQKGSVCKVEKLHCETCGGVLPQHIELKDIWEVTLTSPQLSGDINAFRGLQKLNYLDLHGSQVTGDLQVFESLHSDHVFLANTQIFGDLKSMAKLWLAELDLSDTNITGDLNHFARSSAIGANHLRVLLLGNTSVGGDISSLTKFRVLRDVDLSYSNVVGEMTGAWRGRLPYLSILQLRDTGVQFLPKSAAELEKLKDHSQRGGALLPHLTILDLSNCPVNNTVENLLLPLAACKRLSAIKAAGAGIFGELSRLTYWEVDAQQTVYTSKLALMRDLVSLDLSRNSLTGVSDLPVLPGSGRVNLRENPPLVIAPGVLRKAMKQQIILDLSQTTLTNKDEVAPLLEEGTLKTTDLYAYRDELGGFACKALAGAVEVTASRFLPQKLCKCLQGWQGSGTRCRKCAVDTFADEMGLEICKKCPANSTALEASTKLADCKCGFGSLHNATCTCDKHHALQAGDCILCSKLHLQCNSTGSQASSAVPEINHIRLETDAEEARRCLSPDVSQRCPGSHHCGLGYRGTLCSTCADGFWSSEGTCKPCTAAQWTVVAPLAALAVTAAIVAAWVAFCRASRPQVTEAASVKALLQKLLLLQLPILFQMVQLWTVLSHLRPPKASEGLPEIPYLETLQLTVADLQNSLNLQCTFDAEVIRTLAAISSPLLPLLLLVCCGALELCRAGVGVSFALKTLTLLFIGGASSSSALLSCQAEDGDGRSLQQFAFRKALGHLRCSDGDGVAFWVDLVGYGSAMAYGLLIPLFLAGLMVRQYFALQEACLFYAHVEGDKEITLRLQSLEGEVPKDSQPKRLLAAAAAHLAVHCRGRQELRLQEGYITSSSKTLEVASEVDMFKMAGEEASRRIRLLRSRRLAQMLTERIMLDETDDRLLIGAQSLLGKYTLCQDVWMEVLLKLFAVSLVSCVTMASAWHWAVAFNVGMALVVGSCQPYMQPQVSQLQSFSCLCLAVASVAFVYDSAALARVALLGPLAMMLWQVRYPDCEEALADRLYQELRSELPKLQQGESHEVKVQLFHI